MKYVIIFLFALASLGGGICYFLLKSPFENYPKLAHAITAKTAEKLENEKGLILVGTGGQMMDYIQMMMIGFEYRKVINVETARELLVYCVEEYLSAINASEEVRPYPHNYPFTFKNVEIVIYIRNPDGSTVALDKLRIAAADEGELFYYVDDPEKYTLRVIHEETYEEALQATRELH